MNPEPVGTDQLYVVPAGIIPFVILIGVTVNPALLQIVVLNGLIPADGFIVTVTENTDPLPQVAVLGVTKYVAVMAAFVVLVSVPLILAAPVPDNPPVNPEPVGTDQLYVVPPGTIPLVILTGETVNGRPLQIVLVIAFIATTGFKVTVSVNVVPVQEPDLGVTV